MVEINKTNPVITTRDICNSLGAIVIPKGINITEDVANKIAKYNLDAPIELQVNLAVRISPNELFHDINAVQTPIFDRTKDLSVTKELIRQCGLLNAFPLISQKLTVFEERMPVNYSDTQSVAGLAVLIALKLGLSVSSVEVIFVAAQMHDTGFLNINPETVLNFDSFSEDERRTFYKEQLLLGKSFLDQVPNLPKAVGISVLAHQELTDGSGWPEGIIGDQNTLESQVVGLAVLLHKAYTRKRIMIYWFELAKRFSIEINETQNTKGEDHSLVLISSLEQLYRNSGILEDSIRHWLDEIADCMKPEESTDVELMALMFESVLQKLKCLHWSLRVQAKSLGGEWLIRCDELSVLLYSLPSDHFEAFEKFDCFDG
ncbi:MAG: hypothetical protein ACI84K_001768 [Pseudohongiellaceae bacterium]